MGSLQVRTFSKTNSIPLMESDNGSRMLFPVVLLASGLPNLNGIGRKFIRQCRRMRTSVQICSSSTRMSFSLAWGLLSLT